MGHVKMYLTVEGREISENTGRPNQSLKMFHKIEEN